MTREEAIKIFNTVLFFDKCDCPKEEIEECLKMAIKALEQEPNKDCISRAEAIKCLECDFNITGKENMKTVVNYINSVHNKIVNLPSVIKQESRWIPVSERLPKPNANDGLTARYYLIRNEYEDMLVARYDGMGWTQMYQHEYLEDDVIAWMPLPKPYKGESEPQESEEE